MGNKSPGADWVGSTASLGMQEKRKTLLLLNDATIS
jgi:hypothetical protein